MRKEWLIIVPIAAGFALVIWLAMQQREQPLVVVEEPVAAILSTQRLPPGVKQTKPVAPIVPATPVAVVSQAAPATLALVPTNTPANARPSYLDGELIVRLGDRALSKDIEDLLAQKGIMVIGRATPLRLIRVKLPEDMSMPEAEKMLKDIEGIEETARNGRTDLPKDVNDWPLNDLGEPLAAVEGTGRELINADDPVRAPSFGDNVVVALLDTGVDVAHPDLSGRVLLGYNFIDDNMDASDANGHGTACAGIIAGNNGVAPKACILPVKVMEHDGSGNEFAVIEGILYAIDRGAKNINLSMGTYGDSKLLHEAVVYAVDKGVVVVGAAGNHGGENLLRPAGYAEALCVGAVDGVGMRAPFSNYGDGMDIMAPGVSVNTLSPKGGYVRFSGTSAAAPFVAGALAALIAEYPQLSATELRDRITTTADNIGAAGRDDLTGMGMLNLQRALRKPTDDVYDAAMSSLYIDPPSFKPGDKVTVHFVVQNHGTRDLNGASFVSTIGAERRSETLNALKPGECRDIARSWTVPTDVLNADTTITGMVQTDEADVEPHDNAKMLLFKPELWK